MNCKECGREISDESVFCMFCGTEQDFEELSPESVPEAPVSISPQKRDELAPGHKESTLLTSLRSGRWRRFTDPLTLSLVGISAVLLVAFLVLLFGRPVWEKNRVSSAPTTETTIEETVATRVPKITEPQYLGFYWSYISVYPGEVQSLLNALYYTNEISIQWSSSDPSAISVDENGMVTGILPGATATIEARCIENETYYDTVCVLCISDEIEEEMNLFFELNYFFNYPEDENSAPYFPADRDTELKWDESLLRSLEGSTGGLIDSLRVERISDMTSDSGNPIDYEVYRSPILGLIYKIISIEYLPDRTVLISGFYFKNNGELNHAFVYKDESYNPISTSAADTSVNRFYFSGDVMVRWKSYDPVTGTGEIAIGANERNNTASPYSVIQYSEADPEKRKMFDDHEKRIISKAYQAFFEVANRKPSYGFSGNITDEIGMPVQTDIRLMSSDLNDVIIFSDWTDENGYFRIQTPMNNDLYSLVIDVHYLFEPGTYHNIGALRSGFDTYLGQIRMTSFLNQTSSVQMLITDAINEASIEVDDGFATNKLRLSGAEIRIREGYGNTSGEILETIVSDPLGVASFALETGPYTAEVVMPGYETGVYPILVYPDCPTVRCCLPSELDSGEMCIILTWPDENLDLDAHLFAPKAGQTSGEIEHIWFDDPNDQQGDRLEGDVTRGFEPEVVFIDHVDEGVYKFYVTDYTNSLAKVEYMPELRHSFATVQVFSENGLISSIQVKPGDDSLIWEVFEIRNRSMSHINRYYAGVTDDPWWISEKVTQ